MHNGHPNDRPAIEVRDLAFAYNGDVILEDVNLSIPEHDFAAVIGPNGGGKTTLLKLILGLLTPAQGTIRVFGQPPRRAAKDIGYVPQDTEVNPSVPMTVMQAVLMGCMRGGGGWRRFSESDQERAREALQRAGVWALRQERIGCLSGGQRQRVMLARALVAEPKLLLLDEPTANVDTKGQGEIFDFLKDLNSQVTIVVVSHDLMVLSSYIKSVICVSRRVHFHSRPEVTVDMLANAYQCPVELVTHGHIPHRVLASHEPESHD